MVDLAHFEQFTVDGTNSVKGVQVNWEEYAEADQEDFAAFLEVKPDDYKRDQGYVRNVPQHLDRGIGQGTYPG